MSDNGGAVAISGFNYQNSSIIYTILKYRENETFVIYPEAEEDFKFIVNDEIYYVQVKGEEDLSISKLKQRDKVKGKEVKNTSIIEKNILKGTVDDNHWIFLYDWNSSVGNKLAEDNSHEKFKPLLKYSKNQLKKLKKELEIVEYEIENRITNQRIYKTFFNKDSKNSFRFLKSVLSETFDDNLNTNDATLNTINSELWTLIDQKSEKKLTNVNDVHQFELKAITQKHVEDICSIIKFESHFEKILRKLRFNLAKEKRINLAKFKNDTLYSSLINDVLNQMDNQEYEQLINEESEIEIVEYFENEIKKISQVKIGDQNELTAVAIDCYANKLMEEE